jgi:hypothetical protein
LGNYCFPKSSWQLEKSVVFAKIELFSYKYPGKQKELGDFRVSFHENENVWTIFATRYFSKIIISRKGKKLFSF